MSKEFVWKIEVENTPLLKKKCNHCNCSRFYCSDKFRMNSQKRNVDVWLIYRCVKCDSTYNVTILSRTKTELINKDLFHKFMENDKAVAWEYAFSSEAIRKNNVELDYDTVEYEIKHDNISINDIIESESEIIIFKVKTQFEFSLKLSSVIRKCLGLSVNQLNLMLENGVIFTPTIKSLKKHKIKNGDVVEIYKSKLKAIQSMLKS